MRFASQAEYRRYLELKLFATNLELQPKFPIVVNNKKICTYVADFKYLDDKGNEVIEDVKGVKTPVYKLKKKLVEALYPIKIIET